MVFPAKLLPSKMKSTSTFPSAVSGVISASEVTAFPSASLITFPVFLSIAVPVTLYVFPGMRFVYSTVSVILISFSAYVSFVSVFVSVAVVFTDGTYIICASSEISACTPTSLLL